MLRRALRLPIPSLLSLRHNASNISHRNSSTIPALLSQVSTTKPLKDAVKFTSPNSAKPAVWTYRELSTHVRALCAGLSELGVTSSSVLLALLAPHTPEYAVLLLASARLGVKLVAVPPPKDPSAVKVDVLNEALKKYKPEMLFVGKEFAPASNGQRRTDDGIVAAVNPLINAIAPGVALRDATGLNGFVPLTGRPFDSKEHPYLRHVVQTSDTNVRGTVTFKSLLVYSGEAPKEAKSDMTLLVDAVSGEEWKTAKILKDAKDIGKNMRLSNDHTAREGRLVVTPAVSERNAAGIVSALMHETLWVSPGPDDVKAVSEAENALVV